MPSNPLMEKQDGRPSLKTEGLCNPEEAKGNLAESRVCPCTKPFWASLGPQEIQKSHLIMRSNHRRIFRKGIDQAKLIPLRHQRIHCERLRISGTGDKPVQFVAELGCQQIHVQCSPHVTKETPLGEGATVLKIEEMAEEVSLTIFHPQKVYCTQGWKVKLCQSQNQFHFLRACEASGASLMVYESHSHSHNIVITEQP